MRIIKTADNIYKLITFTQNDSDIVDYDVYSLPGTTLDVVENSFANESFSFPNPSSSRMAIKTSLVKGESSMLEVFDISGKKVIEKNVTSDNGQIDLDVSSLSGGMYIYKIKNQTNKFIKK